jgi:nucleotide-binding universal stress UspA family protein
MAFRKILVPTDFSDPAREALRVAIDLARESKGSLTLVHAWDVSAFAFVGDGLILSSLYADIPAAAEQQLAEWKRDAEKLGAVDIATRLANGPAWDKIVEAAKRESAELIVMGTHGRTGLKHALIGSVAERVVRHAPCPVLVVRPREVRSSD